MAKTRPHFKKKKTRTTPAPASAMRCPAPCGKVRCYSEREAWDVALSLYETRGGEKPERVYRCDLDNLVWHWTRMKTWKETDHNDV